jgi:hypothetical protein
MKKYHLKTKAIIHYSNQKIRNKEKMRAIAERMTVLLSSTQLFLLSTSSTLKPVAHTVAASQFPVVSVARVYFNCLTYKAVQ